MCLCVCVSGYTPWLSGIQSWPRFPSPPRAFLSQTLQDGTCLGGRGVAAEQAAVKQQLGGMHSLEPSTSVTSDRVRSNGAEGCRRRRVGLDAARRDSCPAAQGPSLCAAARAGESAWPGRQRAKKGGISTPGSRSRGLGLPQIRTREKKAKCMRSSGAPTLLIGCPREVWEQRRRCDRGSRFCNHRSSCDLSLGCQKRCASHSIVPSHVQDVAVSRSLLGDTRPRGSWTGVCFRKEGVAEGAGTGRLTTEGPALAAQTPDFPRLKLPCLNTELVF